MSASSLLAAFEGVPQYCPVVEIERPDLRFDQFADPVVERRVGIEAVD